MKLGALSGTMRQTVLSHQNFCGCARMRKEDGKILFCDESNKVMKEHVFALQFISLPEFRFISRSKEFSSYLYISYDCLTGADAGRIMSSLSSCRGFFFHCFMDRKEPQEMMMATILISK
jgi:hypothetical protein